MVSFVESARETKKSSIVRPRRGRLPQAIASLAVFACVLAGCSTGHGEGTDHPADPQSPTGPAAAKFASIEASHVGAATQLVMSAPDMGVKADVPRFDEARNLSAAIEVVRGRQLRQAAWASASAVDVSSSVISAAGSVVGVVVTSVATIDGAKVEVPASIWYDAVSHQSYSGAALIAPERWGDFSAAVAEAARIASVDADKATAALAEAAAPYGKAPAMGFSSGGDLVLAFASGVVGDGVTTLSLPADQASQWLSTFGTRALGGARYPSRMLAKPTDAPDASLRANSGRAPITIGPDCKQLKCVALTYDDGPGERSPELVKTFLGAKVPATFFQMGNSIKAFPGRSLQMAAVGMEIGNHTVTHADLARKGAERVTREVAENSGLIKEALGETPTLFRPPYGSHNARVDGIVKANDMSIIQWSVDTLDWKTRDTANTVQVATSIDKYSQPIVLMHDIHSSTVDAAPEIIKNLTGQGYTIVTVQEMSLNTGGLRAGHAYCHGTGSDQAGFNCKG